MLRAASPLLPVVLRVFFESHHASPLPRAKPCPSISCGHSISDSNIRRRRRRSQFIPHRSCRPPSPPPSRPPLLASRIHQLRTFLWGEHDDVHILSSVFLTARTVPTESPSPSRLSRNCRRRKRRPRRPPPARPRRTLRRPPVTQRTSTMPPSSTESSRSTTPRPVPATPMLSCRR